MSHLGYICTIHFVENSANKQETVANYKQQNNLIDTIKEPIKASWQIGTLTAKQ